MNDSHTEPVKNKKTHVYCKKCGKCCIVLDGSKWIPCPYLSSKNLCIIYNTRLKTRISKTQSCNLRIFSCFDYPGCPYNKGKQLHPAYRQ